MGRTGAGVGLGGHVAPLLCGQAMIGSGAAGAGVGLGAGAGVGVGVLVAVSACGDTTAAGSHSPPPHAASAAQIKSV